MKIMKKILLSLTALVLGCAYSAADTRQVVLLLHQGTGTEYAYDQLQQALDAATAGDTLYLNEGDYPINGDALTISHPVSIIGTGINTRLLGKVDISIPDSVTLTSYLLDALRVNGSVRVQQPVNGLKYRKCYIEGTVSWNATTRDVLVDRCYIGQFNHTINLKSANVVNSRIKMEYTPKKSDGNNYGNSLTFINCTIENLRAGGYSGLTQESANNYSTYINSIIGNQCYDDAGNSRDYYLNNCSFINSLVGFTIPAEVNVKENCYYPNQPSFFDWNQINGTVASQEELIERGYLGTDGTVIGPEGGSAPYTLIPSGISVRESKLTIDGENRTLNVRLKLTSN